MITSIFILLMMDYILTYISLTLGICFEANILMRWLMELPLWEGLILRTIMSVLVLIPFYVCKKKNIKLYNKACIIALSIEVIPFLAHLYWVFMLDKII